MLIQMFMFIVNVKHFSPYLKLFNAVDIIQNPRSNPNIKFNIYITMSYLFKT